jgi:hypothetical protein
MFKNMQRNHMEQKSKIVSKQIKTSNKEIDFIKDRYFRRNIVGIFHKSKYRSKFNKDYYYLLQMID